MKLFSDYLNCAEILLLIRNKLFYCAVMIRTPTVATAVIFDRTLGCADESATDAEQGEKILYYYPPYVTLDQQVSLLYWPTDYKLGLKKIVITNFCLQLTKVNMLEGLIEFSNKFSSEPLDIIVMEVLFLFSLLCFLRFNMFDIISNYSLGFQTLNWIIRKWHGGFISANLMFG